MKPIIDFLLKLYYHTLGVLKKVANISNGTDVFGTIENIKKDIDIRGSNIWILVCSTMLASIGLDLNSAAVIIGAMLISPLMSPILGIGLAVGINDRDTLVKSLQNFGLAITVSLLTSTFYFLISPLGEPTSEMIARTQPTLLDVFVALFGGVAGIVAGSRMEKTNAIPGVAIATALMPPICVAGFGIATGYWNFFIGAFYLFFINAVFIAAATYSIVRFLKFPFKEFMNMEQKKKVTRWMAIFAILIMAPSFYFLYSIIGDVRLKKEIKQFVTEYVEPENAKLMDWRLVKTDTQNYIDMTLHGNYLSEQKIESLKKHFEKEVDYKLVLGQLSDMSLKEMDKRTSELRNDFTTALEDKQAAIIQKTIANKELQDKLNKALADTIPFANVNRELKAIFPELESFAYTKVKYQNTNLPTALITWDKKIRKSQKKQNEERFYQFLINRLDLDTLQIVNH